MNSLIFMGLVSAMVIVGLAGVSLAGHGHHGCSDKRMSNLSEMDADKDGVISLDEFSEPYMEKYRGWFNMLDANEDGYLSQEEWDAFRKEHGHGGSSEG